MEQVAGRYTLNPPDVISISVQGIESPLTSIVQPDGYVLAPKGKEVYVAGLTIAEASEAIKGSLEDVYARPPETTVTVLSFESNRVYVFGEVNGVIPYRGNLSVVDTVIQAGGLTIRSAPNRTLLIRYTDGDPKVFDINLNDIIRKGNDETNLMVRGGDILYVPPTRMVKLGYHIENLLFPIHSIFGGIRQALSFDNY